MDSETKLRRLRDSHERDMEKVFHQHELIVGNHNREVWSLRKQAEETEKATASIENCDEATFSWCTSLDQVVGSRSAAFG